MLGIKPRTIQIWFQNQRQKAKMRQGNPGGGNAPERKQDAEPINLTTSSARPDLQWIQLQGAVHNATIPAIALNGNNAAIRSPILAIHGMHHLPIIQPNQNYTHLDLNIPSNVIQRGPQEPEAPRGGLDILASIASITNAAESESLNKAAIIRQHNEPHLFRITGSEGSDNAMMPQGHVVLPNKPITSMEGKIAINALKKNSLQD
jgi:hypothetical protein